MSKQCFYFSLNAGRKNKQVMLLPFPYDGAFISFGNHVSNVIGSVLNQITRRKFQLQLSYLSIAHISLFVSLSPQFHAPYFRTIGYNINHKQSASTFHASLATSGPCNAVRPCVSLVSRWQPAVCRCSACILHLFASSTLSTEAVFSSRAWVNFYRTKRRHTREDSNIYLSIIISKII
jgi:hypothetical protein